MAVPRPLVANSQRDVGGLPDVGKMRLLPIRPASSLRQSAAARFRVPVFAGDGDRRRSDAGSCCMLVPFGLIGKDVSSPASFRRGRTHIALTLTVLISGRIVRI
ncbi:MAG: hypothetical protein ACLRWP_12535 [Bilophila wadsworthia]